MNVEHNTYRVARARDVLCREHLSSADLPLEWSGASWVNVPVMQISNFLEQSSAHRPKVELKIQYSYWGIHGLFNVKDRYVRCVQTNFQDKVCKDSCVEIYFQPFPERVLVGFRHPSYLNLEISGNGTLLSYHIRDSERTNCGFSDYTEVAPEDGDRIKVRSSLPSVVEPEISDEVDWQLAFFLPFAVMSQYFGEVSDPWNGVQGQLWRANAFKCADESSHPHWCSWQPCSELNFHIPSDFGYILFE